MWVEFGPVALRELPDNGNEEREGVLIVRRLQRRVVAAQEGLEDAGRQPFYIFHAVQREFRSEQAHRHARARVTESALA